MDSQEDLQDLWVPLEPLDRVGVLLVLLVHLVLREELDKQEELERVGSDTLELQDQLETLERLVHLVHSTTEPATQDLQAVGFLVYQAPPEQQEVSLGVSQGPLVPQGPQGVSQGAKVPPGPLVPQGPPGVRQVPPGVVLGPRGAQG